MALAAASSLWSKRCEYRSSVVLARLWPSRRDTVTGSVLEAMRAEAWGIAGLALDRPEDVSVTRRLAQAES